MLPPRHGLASPQRKANQDEQDDWDDDRDPALEEWAAEIAESECPAGPFLHSPQQPTSEQTEILISGSRVPPRPRVPEDSKPLVDPPEFGDSIRDTDKQAYWIPGAFPTIFQNETGDPHNYQLREPDLVTWGPHVMRSRGWHAQAHMTFMYWWMNMIQRTQEASAGSLASATIA